MDTITAIRCSGRYCPGVLGTAENGAIEPPGRCIGRRDIRGCDGISSNGVRDISFRIIDTLAQSLEIFGSGFVRPGAPENRPTGGDTKVFTDIVQVLARIPPLAIDMRAGAGKLCG